MPLRIVRGRFENTHGYLCPVRAVLSSGPDHDVGFLVGGAPYARNARVLDVTEVPIELSKYGLVGTKLAYCSLAGALDLGFTSAELLKIIEREHQESTYGEYGVIR
jgi:hypothetical protein